MSRTDPWAGHVRHEGIWSYQSHQILMDDALRGRGLDLSWDCRRGLARAAAAIRLPDAIAINAVVRVAEIGFRQ